MVTTRQMWAQWVRPSATFGIVLVFGTTMPRAAMNAGGYGNLASYFTYQCAAIAVGAMLAATVRSRTHATHPALDMPRGAAASYFLVMGSIYSIFLAQPQARGGQGFAEWVGHLSLPCIMLLDWGIDPPREEISAGQALAIWMPYPLAWLAYTVLRGSRVGWYPYPFLDPRAQGSSPVRVAELSALFILGLAVACLLVAALGGAGAKRLTAADGSRDSGLGLGVSALDNEVERGRAS
jgi:hypothetical protein